MPALHRARAWPWPCFGPGFPYGGPQQQRSVGIVPASSLDAAYKPPAARASQNLCATHPKRQPRCCCLELGCLSPVAASPVWPNHGLKLASATTWRWRLCETEEPLSHTWQRLSLTAVDVKQQQSYQAVTPTLNSLLFWVHCKHFHILIIYLIECSTLICITAWHPAASVLWTLSRYPCDGG